MEDNKLTCDICMFSAFLANEEAWWCPKLKTYVDPDLRQHNCPLGESKNPCTEPHC